MVGQPRVCDVNEDIMPSGYCELLEIMFDY